MIRKFFYIKLVATLTAFSWTEMALEMYNEYDESCILEWRVFLDFDANGDGVLKESTANLSLHLVVA